MWNLIKKNKLIVFLIAFAIILTVILMKNIDNNSDDNIMGESDSVSIKIAVCPTIFSRFNGVGDIELVKVNSTYDAVQRLKQRDVQYVLSGRVPKPTENVNHYVILEEGMSFISSTERSILYSELIEMKIYTDSNIQNTEFTDIERVDNVYEYLDKGIVITSWENTDYSRAGIVHILNEDGTRWGESRTPVLYCSDECDSKLIEYLQNYGREE